MLFVYHIIEGDSAGPYVRFSSLISSSETSLWTIVIIRPSRVLYFICTVFHYETDSEIRQLDVVIFID